MKSLELLTIVKEDYSKIKDKTVTSLYNYKWSFMGSILYINLDQKGLFFIDHNRCINFKAHLPDYNLDKLGLQFGFVNHPSEFRLMMTTYGMENAFKILIHILEIEVEFEGNTTYSIF